MESEETLYNRMTDEAAGWLIRLTQDRSPEGLREFEAWCAEHPRHAQAFELAERRWTQLDGLDRSFPEPPAQVPRASVIELMAGNRPGPLERWLAQHGKVDVPRTRRRSAHWMSIAAGVAVLSVGLLLLQWAPWAQEQYSTAVGSQQVLKLSDGSIVQLNTDSRIEVRFTKAERDIRLEKGEALFTVAHDANRPFFVVTSNARVRAIGTKFNVYRRADGQTRVAVLEGTVQLSADAPSESASQAQRSMERESQVESWPPADAAGATSETAAVDRSLIQLTAGAEATVVGASISQPPVADVQRATAWQARKLVFDSAPINDIVSEFNRYNPIRIVILNESIGSRRMAGTFEADDPSPLIGYLSRDPAIEIERVGSELRIALKGHDIRSVN